MRKLEYFLKERRLPYYPLRVYNLKPSFKNKPQEVEDYFLVLAIKIKIPKPIVTLLYVI